MEDEPARASAGGTLRRLVCFLASALDVRFAFVLAFGPEGGRARVPVTSWLAKDYGLRSEVTEVDLHAPPPTPARLDVLSVLQRAYAHEPELAGGSEADVVSLPLIADDRRFLGYLGIVDPEGRRILTAPEHLRPLARTAAAEVRRWLEA
jgi:hypothetical protein